MVIRPEDSKNLASDSRNAPNPILSGRAISSLFQRHEPDDSGDHEANRNSDGRPTIDENENAFRIGNKA